MFPKIRPEDDPEGWHEWGGIYRCRARGFVYKDVSILPSSILMFMSMNTACWAWGENVQDTPPLLMDALNLT